MSTIATEYVHLAPNPKSSYLQLFVKGTRIRARILYGWYACEEDPMTPEQIAAEYSLPVEAVLEAIVYCESDPPELLEDYAREEALMEATGMNDPDYKYNPSPKLLSPQERARLKRL
jgi:uncharacterized protein (DUF433 family)